MAPQQKTSPFEPLELPSDEIGWSDESFDLAVKYISHHTNSSEAIDMRDWLLEHIAKDALWAVSRNIAFNGHFKRTILLSFRYFEPSAMQNAFNEVKRNPRKDLKRRNRLIVASNVAMGAIGFAMAIAMIMFIIQIPLQ